MALNPAALGALMVANVGPTDAPGIAIFTALGAPFITWTIANVVVNPLGGSPLIAVGPVITGTGALVCGPALPLGALLAVACGTTDAAGFAKWNTVAKHYVDTLTNYGGLDPSLLIAYTGPIPPPSGAVSGVAIVKLQRAFDFGTALGITDTAGKAKWTAFGAALRTHLETASTVSPSMVNTAPAGPVTGTGSIS